MHIYRVNDYSPGVCRRRVLRFFLTSHISMYRTLALSILCFVLHSWAFQLSRIANGRSVNCALWCGDGYHKPADFLASILEYGSHRMAKRAVNILHKVPRPKLLYFDAVCYGFQLLI
jgi:hypothetical protein